MYSQLFSFSDACAFDSIIPTSEKVSGTVITASTAALGTRLDSCLLKYLVKSFPFENPHI